MIVSLMQFYQTFKGQSSTELNMRVNTRPGTCTTHHLIGTLFSYIPVKIFSYKQCRWIPISWFVRRQIVWICAVKIV